LRVVSVYGGIKVEKINDRRATMFVENIEGDQKKQDKEELFTP